MPAGLILAGTAGLSALGQGLGFLSQSRANEQNMEMFNRSLEFQKYMYEDTKHYNSAVEQVKRLRAAGINPAFAMGALSAGQTTAGSPPSANPQQPYNFGELGGVASGLVNDLAQRELLQAQKSKIQNESSALEIDNSFRRENWLSTLYNRDMDSWTKEKASDLQKLDIQFQTQSMKNRLLKLEYETQYQDALLTAQDITNQYLPSQLAETCAELIARQYANYATGRASLKSANAAIMQAMNQMHAFDAQYGGSPEDRGKFFKANLDNLIQLRDTRTSEEFRNISGHNPLPYNTGLWRQYNGWKLSGHGSYLKWSDYKTR